VNDMVDVISEEKALFLIPYLSRNLS